MTSEEAIKVLKEGGITLKECEEAFDMAFKALEAEPREEYLRGWQDAITTALKETHDYHTEDGVFRAVQEESLVGIGMIMPSVKPVRKTGQWIDARIRTVQNEEDAKEYPISEEEQISEELDFIQPKKVVGKMIDMSVIEDIRAEIIKNRDRNIGGNGNIKDFLDGYRIAFNEALAIIERHTSGEEQK